ncbi:MAG: NUDIX domain-containing protein [Myxococcota bacterium]
MHTRASAYALAIHNDCVLLTQLAAYCRNGGHWTLPGGGIDHGEQPHETVVREAVEETSLHAKDLALLHARTFSETGGSGGDFLAVQIVYSATMVGPPSVQEVGGSTAAVAWVPLSEVAALPTVSLVGAALAAWSETRV